MWAFSLWSLAYKFNHCLDLIHWYTAFLLKLPLCRHWNGSSCFNWWQVSWWHFYSFGNRHRLLSSSSNWFLYGALSSFYRNSNSLDRREICCFLEFDGWFWIVISVINGHFLGCCFCCLSGSSRCCCWPKNKDYNSRCNSQWIETKYLGVVTGARVVWTGGKYVDGTSTFLGFWVVARVVCLWVASSNWTAGLG